MRIYDKSGKLSIFTVLDFIFQDTKDIKTRKNGISEINIIHEGLLTVITTFDRIGSSNNCTTSLKSSHNTSFWNRNTLLFHSFMNRGSILLIHLVKLINQTDSLVSKNHSSTFQSPFSCARISMNTGGETNSCSTFTGCIDYSMESFFNIFKNLGFSSTRISE